MRAHIWQTARLNKNTNEPQLFHRRIDYTTLSQCDQDTVTQWTMTQAAAFSRDATSSFHLAVPLGPLQIIRKEPAADETPESRPLNTIGWLSFFRDDRARRKLLHYSERFVAAHRGHHLLRNALTAGTRGECDAGAPFESQRPLPVALAGDTYKAFELCVRASVDLCRPGCRQCSARFSFFRFEIDRSKLTAL